MNLQLHTVLSDLTGVSGLKIARGILAGERDAEGDDGCRIAGNVPIVISTNGKNPEPEDRGAWRSSEHRRVATPALAGFTSRPRSTRITSAPRWRRI